MCGIVGFIGTHQEVPILLSGLSKLEYRGYDSAGLVVRNGSEPVEIVKSKGRLRGLEEKTNNGNALQGTCGIGHTRWATHGEPSELNSHPHHSDDQNVIAVHNGIIENYQELKTKLTKKGYEFYTTSAILKSDVYEPEKLHFIISTVKKSRKNVKKSCGMRKQPKKPAMSIS